MKAYRAYIAGLGTSGVLIASFVLLLAVVSAIVAFNGAPGKASNDGLDRLDVSHGRQASNITAADPSGGQRDGKAAARGDRGRAGHGAGRDGRGAGQFGRAGAGGVDGERAFGGGGGGSAADGSAPAGESGGANGNGGGNGGGLSRLPVNPGAPRGVPQAPSAGDVASGLGDAVEETTGGLGETVGSAAPPLEPPIVQTGDVAAGGLDQAGPVVDRAVGDVTGAVGGVTDRVTGATGGLPGGGGN